MVVCEDSGCKPGEVCAVVKGVRRCVANSRSICQATGDPHYTTFDGRRYDFMGTCVYLLAGLCSTDPTLTPFAVTVENNHRGSHLVSFTKVVTMEVYNMTLSLSQEHPQKVKVGMKEMMGVVQSLHGIWGGLKVTVWSSGAFQGHHMIPGWSFKVLVRCLGGFQSIFKASVGFQDPFTVFR